jgi:hypothetical protein
MAHTTLTDPAANAEEQYVVLSINSPRQAGPDCMMSRDVAVHVDEKRHMNHDDFIDD